MPRFVILRHDSPQGTHFDFMLEVGDVLKTWALAQPPMAGVEMECDELADHRAAYLDYEGPISGGRGTVTRWDHGNYTVLRQSDDQYIVELAGERLIGEVTLRLEPGTTSRWVLTYNIDTTY